MAIVTALRGFNDLGHSVTPTFLSETDFIYNDLRIVQKSSKTERGKFKAFKIPVHGTLMILPSCDCKVRETTVAKFELVPKGASPVD